MPAPKCQAAFRVLVGLRVGIIASLLSLPCLAPASGGRAYTLPNMAGRHVLAHDLLSGRLSLTGRGELFPSALPPLSNKTRGIV